MSLLTRGGASPNSTVRARSGCLNCRKRRKKCDEVKPSCNRCQKHADDCRWQPDFEFRLSGVNSQHPSMVQLDSLKRSSQKDLKIVDVTFGPRGPKRTRRDLVRGEQPINSESKSIVEGRHPELMRSQIEDLPTTQKRSRPCLTPNESPTASILPPVEQQTFSNADDQKRQKRMQSTVIIAESNNISSIFPSPVIQKQLNCGNGEDQQDDDTTLEQCSIFPNTVCDRHVLQNVKPVQHPTSLHEQNNPLTRESLDLEVLDYLASNPFNLDLLTSESWSNPTTMVSESLDGTVHGSPPATPASTPGSSPNLYVAFYHDAANKDLHSQLHDRMVRTARDMALTRHGTPEESPSTSAKGPRQQLAGCANEPIPGSSPLSNRSWSANLHLSEDRYIELWQNYLDEIAPWLDLFDNENHWRTTVAHMAQRVECLQYSLLALSSRQQERRNPGSLHTESLNLYQVAIRSIMAQLPTLSTEIIAACVLLCVLEMMCTSPRAWGKHLDGCSILLEAAGINGVVGGVQESLFWTFARMDVYRAFIGDTVTTPPTNRWFISVDSMSAAVRIFKNKSGSDSYANYMVFLCAGVMNILSKQSSSWAIPDHSSRETFVSRWKAMYDLHESWYRDRPEELRPLMYVPVSKKESQSPFSTILYSTPVGISSNIMYHASIILLLQDKPKEVILPKSHKSQLWHARQVWGIALSNSDHGALIHSLQPMWIAGRLMSHHSEHKAILDFLKHLEEQTGWGTSWRAKDLREFWGVCDEDG